MVESTTGGIAQTSVVIPDNEEGDRIVENSGVKAPGGWAKAWSDPPGGKQLVAGRSSSEPVNPRMLILSEADDAVIRGAEPFHTRRRPMPSAKN